MTQQPSGGDQVSRIYDSIVDAARTHRKAGKSGLAINLLETVIRLFQPLLPTTRYSRLASKRKS